VLVTSSWTPVQVPMRQGSIAEVGSVPPEFPPAWLAPEDAVGEVDPRVVIVFDEPVLRRIRIASPASTAMIATALTALAVGVLGIYARFLGGGAPYTYACGLVGGGARCG